MHLGYVASRDPQALAVVIGDRRITYAALDAASRRIACEARERGLQRGDALAVLAANGPEFLAAVWAAQRSGLYALPLGTRLTAGDLAYLLADSGAGLLVTDSTQDELAHAALAAIDAADNAAKPHHLSLADTEALFAEHDAPADPDPVEGGDMLYTSGTTGRPKGVRRPLAYGELGSEFARARRLQSLFHFNAESVFLSPAPLYHAAPLRFAMAVLRLGGTLVLMPRFDAATALHLLHQEKVTHSQWVPTMFKRLLALPVELRPIGDSDTHRVAIHAGAPCPAQIKHRMIDWWGPILHEYYSGTESVGFTHITSEEWLQHPGSVGRPWGCEVHILDDNSQSLPPGEVGGVYFSGRGAPAYHNAVEKTAAALAPQGYATMGDIGYLDQDGYLYLTDRKAFTIISGGVNIYPREIEDALHQDARVAEAAVFGVPDDDLGEAVCAVIQLAPGVAAEQTTAAAIHSALGERLARFKLPRRIAFHDSLPLTDSGKLHKAHVREHWSQECDTVFTFTASSQVTDAAPASRSPASLRAPDKGGTACVTP